MCVPNPVVRQDIREAIVGLTALAAGEADRALERRELDAVALRCIVRAGKLADAIKVLQEMADDDYGAEPDDDATRGAGADEQAGRRDAP